MRFFSEIVYFSINLAQIRHKDYKMDADSYLWLKSDLGDDFRQYDTKTIILRPLFGHRGEKQALVGAIPFCSEYPGPRFEDKFRSSNQMDGNSIADGGKMVDC